MNSSNLDIRQASRAELDLILSWAKTEGWNPGPHDADAYWAADPKGFLIAEHQGNIIGGGSVVAYDERLGFMGLFIVKPEFRGRGLGRELWRYRRDSLRGRLGPDGTIGLDGVEAMQPFYAKGGFVLQHSTTRYLGPVSPQSIDMEERTLLPANEVPFERIDTFDQDHFGAQRSGFLRTWLSAEGTRSLALLDREGSVVGLGSIRPGVLDGFKVGPLFARSSIEAKVLFNALAADTGSANVYIDVPEINPEGLALVKSHDLQPQFTCGRMVLGTPVALPWNRIYGLTSFELG